VAGAALCVIAGLGCMLLAWRALLADLGSPLPLPAAIRVIFIGQWAWPACTRRSSSSVWT
jgi:hypothetical protein